QAITASPVSAATAAMIGVLSGRGIGLTQILLICVPSTLLAVIIAAFVQLRVGKELKDDPEYQRLLASGELQPPSGKAEGKEPPPLKRGATTSAIIFLLGVVLVVLAGIYPELRTVSGGPGEKPTVLDMPIAIGIVMLAVAALILTITKAPVAEVPK